MNQNIQKGPRILTNGLKHDIPVFITFWSNEGEGKKKVSMITKYHNHTL